MDFSGLESTGSKLGGSKVTRLQCTFCHKWVNFEEHIRGRGEDEVEELPCPHCGDSGEQFRAKREEVTRALELYRQET